MGAVVISGSVPIGNSSDTPAVGDGVKVAVLDSGCDQEHPDAESIVDTSVDFTGEGAQDTDGHGTHVASAIAGGGPSGRAPTSST